MYVMYVIEIRLDGRKRPKVAIVGTPICQVGTSVSLSITPIVWKIKLRC
jgi:hypothetical protein